MELYRRSISKAFDVAGPLKLEVSSAIGGVSVHGKPEPRAEVTVTIEVYAESAEEADREADWVGASIAYDEANGLVIRPPLGIENRFHMPFHIFDFAFFSREFLKVSYDIQVPQETRAELSVALGRLEVRDIAGPLQARSANGPVQVEDVAGPVDLRSPNGKLTLRRCRGDVAAHVANGKVEASEVGGSLKIDTANGSVDVEEVGGGLFVKGANGSVRYKGAVGGDFDLQLTNGGIKLELPADSRFEVDAESRHGTVHSDFAVKDEPASGQRAPRLYLRTLNGVIHIGELKATPQMAV